MKESDRVWVIVRFWSNSDGCGVHVEGVFQNSRLAQATYIPLKKASEGWNEEHPDCIEQYIMEETYFHGCR